MCVGRGAARFRLVKDCAVRYRHAKARGECRSHRSDLNAHPTAEIIAILLLLRHGRLHISGLRKKTAGWWCPHWHRWNGLHRLLLLAPSHECAERAQTNDPGRAFQPLIEVPGIRNYV